MITTTERPLTVPHHEGDIADAVERTGARLGWTHDRRRRTTEVLRILPIVAAAGGKLAAGQLTEMVQHRLSPQHAGYLLADQAAVCVEHGWRPLGSLVINKATGKVGAAWEPNDTPDAGEDRGILWDLYGTTS